MYKPPQVLIKTWLEIYYSNNHTDEPATVAIAKQRLLENFINIYEAEMYLFKLNANTTSVN